MNIHLQLNFDVLSIRADHLNSFFKKRVEIIWKTIHSQFTETKLNYWKIGNIRNFENLLVKSYCKRREDIFLRIKKIFSRNLGKV